MIKKIVKILTKNKLTLSVAESVTGGLICNTITSLPGASNYFAGGVIAYSNGLKNRILKIKKEHLKKFGSVSEVIAKDMARNIRTLTNSDFAIATTGIAGPSGGTAFKPVGLVYIAFSSRGKTVVKKFNFKGGRLAIMEQAKKEALKLLLDFLNKLKE